MGVAPATSSLTGQRDSTSFRSFPSESGVASASTFIVTLTEG